MSSEQLTTDKPDAGESVKQEEALRFWDEKKEFYMQFGPRTNKEWLALWMVGFANHIISARTAQLTAALAETEAMRAERDNLISVLSKSREAEEWAIDLQAQLTAAHESFKQVVQDSRKLRSQLSALRTKLAEVEGQRDALRMDHYGAVKCARKLDEAKSDLASLRSLLAGATLIKLGNAYIAKVKIHSADGTVTRYEANLGGRLDVDSEYFETIEQAFAFVGGKDGE